MYAWFPFWMLSGCTLAVSLCIGCQPSEFSENAAAGSSSNCGYFEGEVVASWDGDGRKMKLREDFSYVDPDNRRWTAPAGSVVDGASIPAAFWTFIGGPFEGRYRNASVVHDVGCNEMTASWEDVHRMFYDACICGGVDPQTAKLLYYAVYHYGPRWEVVVETVVETHQNAAGQPVEEQVERRRTRRTKPTPPTSDDIQQAVELIQDENPAPAVLEETTQEVLRQRPRRGTKRNRSSLLELQGNNSAAQPSTKQPVDLFTTPPRDFNTAKRQKTPFSASEQPNRYRQNARQAGHQNGMRVGKDRDFFTVPAISEEERQWVFRQVRDHLVSQQQDLPDEFGLERTQEGYQLELRYYERNQQNEPIGYSPSRATARVSSSGQILDIR